MWLSIIGTRHPLVERKPRSTWWTGLLHSQQLVSLWVQPYGDGFATEAVDGPLLFSAGLVSLFSDLTWGQQYLFI